MIRFTAIMLPYVILVCGTAFLSGVLQVHRRFALPGADASSAEHYPYRRDRDRRSMLLLKPGVADVQLQTRLAYWLSVFVLVAGCVQFSMLLPALRRIGFD